MVVCYNRIVNVKRRTRYQDVGIEEYFRGGGDFLSLLSDISSSYKINKSFYCSGHKSYRDIKYGFTLAEVLITLGIIGVVAAITLPSLINKYQKKIVVNRLKKAYSVISQAVEMSVNDHGDIENWNFGLETQEFTDTYLSPYFQKIVSTKKVSDSAYSKTYVLADGTSFYGWMYSHSNVYARTTFYRIMVDTNGEKKPNRLGRDTFIFYIFPWKSNFYNTGTGNCAREIPKAGLYPDGYGYNRDKLLNDSWRGCNKNDDDQPPAGYEGSSIQAGAFCTALIMIDGWEIADDYKW